MFDFAGERAMSREIKTFERVAISKRLRFEVFKRDGFECAYCGATPPGVLLECDHIDPVSAGGPTEIDNLVTACRSCNRGKSNVSLSTVPQSMSERAAEVLEREAQVSGYQAVMKHRRMRLEADAQEILELFCGYFTGREGISKNEFTSIKMFVDRLGLDECIESAEKSFQKIPYSYQRAFKYFCGSCWGKLRDIEGESR